MVRLKILGSAELSADDGRELRSVLQQPKRLALISYLALTATDRFIRRDQLLGIFWPEVQDSRGRSALSVALSRIRSSLGPGVVVTRGVEEVGLSGERIWCDALLFEDALEHDRLERAAELYTGPLLHGFVLDNGPSFDQWLEQRRSWFQRSAVDCLGRLADAAWERGDPQARHWAEAACRHGPLDEHAAHRLVLYLGAGGHRSAALKLFDNFAERLLEQRGLKPSPEIVELVARVREGRLEEPPPRAPRTEDGASPSLLPKDAELGARTGVEATPGRPPRAGRWSRLLPYLAAAGLGLFIGGRLAPFSDNRDLLAPVTVSLPFADSGGLRLGGRWDSPRPSRRSIAISPSGHLIAYAARGPRRDDPSYLFVRDMRTGRVSEVDGSEGAANPFFSPTGEWIGFFAGEALRRFSTVTGEMETVVATAALPEGPRAEIADFHASGATWSPEGTILFAGLGGLYSVPQGGGVPELVLGDDPSVPHQRRDHALLQPHVLPGGRRLLFQVFTGGPARSAEVHLLDLESGDRHRLLSDAAHPSYLESGHLLFVRRGSLMAVEVQGQALTPRGEVVTLVDDVAQSLLTANSDFETGIAQYAISSNGHLVYVRGGLNPSTPAGVFRYTADGGFTRVEGLETDRPGYLRLAPDGSAVVQSTGHWSSDTLVVTRLHAMAGMPIATRAHAALWSPDGAKVAYRSREDGRTYLAAIDEARPSEPMTWTSPAVGAQPLDWSADGTMALYAAQDIWITELDDAPRPLIATPGDDRDAAFSPDGRWLAYVSEVSGRPEVYVSALPNAQSSWPVSDRGGVNPAWSPEGDRLYYLELSSVDPRHLVAVDLSLDEGFQSARPRRLFPWPASGRIPARAYDVGPDGSLWVSAPLEADRHPAASLTEYTVVLNFVETVKQRLGR